MRVQRPRALHRVAQATIALIFLCSIVFTLSSCGTRTQELADSNRDQLDHLLQRAQVIGVPVASLQSIIKQEHQLLATKAPFSLLDVRPVDTYYQAQMTRYAQLMAQLQWTIALTTRQTREAAERDMRQFQATLAQKRANGLPVSKITQQFADARTLFVGGQTPKDYMTVSSNAQVAMRSLGLMQLASDQLTTFKRTVDQMQDAHLNVALMRSQYQDDQHILAGVEHPGDVQQLNALIDAHYQQAVANSTGAIPYIGLAKMHELEQNVNDLKKFGKDASQYQQRLDADRLLMKKAKTIQSYRQLISVVDQDKAAMEYDLLSGEANYLVGQVEREAEAWGNAHLFHDKFDGNDYPLSDGYLHQGVGDIYREVLGWDVTSDHYREMIAWGKDELFSLHMMEQDYKDHTPYTKVHATDLKMLDRYKLFDKQVVMVSLVEQAMRVFDKGKLVKSFLVTTGRYEMPAVPGDWPEYERRQGTTFSSTRPKGSAYWYPPTPINYAIEYHRGGYFIHDAWWRADYGPGTQFPHVDSGGDQSFAGNGSHGCINMAENDAAWVYFNTDWDTHIVVY